MTTITLRAGLRLPSIMPFLALKQEFPLGKFDPVSNTSTFTVDRKEADRLLKKYERSILYTLVEVV